MPHQSQHTGKKCPPSCLKTVLKPTVLGQFWRHSGGHFSHYTGFRMPLVVPTVGTISLARIIYMILVHMAVQICRQITNWAGSWISVLSCHGWQGGIMELMMFRNDPK